MEQSPDPRYLDELWAIYKEASLARFRILPAISSLATALLVVATFNPELLPLTTSVKIILSMLLLLMPVSLFIYLEEANEAAINGAQAIESVIPGFSENTYDNIWGIILSKKPLKNKVRVLFPWFVTTVFLFSALIFIYHIWC